MYFTQEQITNLEKAWKLVSEPGGRAKSTIHPLLLKANIDRFYRAAILPQPQLKNIFLYPRRRFNQSKHSRDKRQSDSPQKLLYIHLYIIRASVFELMFFCKELASAHVCGSSLRSKPRAVTEAVQKYYCLIIGTTALPHNALTGW